MSTKILLLCIKSKKEVTVEQIYNFFSARWTLKGVEPITLDQPRKMAFVIFELLEEADEAVSAFHETLTPLGNVQLFYSRKNYIYKPRNFYGPKQLAQPPRATQTQPFGELHLENLPQSGKNNKIKVGCSPNGDSCQKLSEANSSDFPSTCENSQIGHSVAHSASQSLTEFQDFSKSNTFSLHCIKKPHCRPFSFKNTSLEVNSLLIGGLPIAENSLNVFFNLFSCFGKVKCIATNKQAGYVIVFFNKILEDPRKLAVLESRTFLGSRLRVFETPYTEVEIESLRTSSELSVLEGQSPSLISDLGWNSKSFFDESVKESISSELLLMNVDEDMDAADALEFVKVVHEPIELARFVDPAEPWRNCFVVSCMDEMGALELVAIFNRMKMKNNHLSLKFVRLQTEKRTLFANF